jgi:hypothetical protein
MAFLAIIGPIMAAVSAAATAAEIGYQLANQQHTNVQGPRVNDLQISTSADGAPIPFGYATSRVGAQIIWSSGIQEHSKSTTQGGGSFGGSSVTTTTYTYTSSFAACFGEGPGIITRIWADSKLVYDSNPSAATDVPAWDSATNYNAGDVVFFSGTIYAARASSLNIEPSSG